MKSVKLYDCKVCGNPFAKQRSTQKVCGSFACTVAIAKQSAEKRASKAVAAAIKAAKAERKADKAKRLAMKPAKYWEDIAQKDVNELVRFRDRNQPCISCGRNHQGQWHAGHFYSTKARPDIRFNLDNIHKQCQPCNTELSGNILSYRENLIPKIGMERLDALARNEVKKLSSAQRIENAKLVSAEAKAKLKELKTMEACNGI